MPNNKNSLPKTVHGITKKARVGHNPNSKKWEKWEADKLQALIPRFTKPTGVDWVSLVKEMPGRDVGAVRNQDIRYKKGLKVDAKPRINKKTGNEIRPNMCKKCRDIDGKDVFKMGHTCDYRFLSDKEVKLCVFVRRELQLDLDVTMAELQGDNDNALHFDLDELEAYATAPLNQGSAAPEAIVEKPIEYKSVGLKLKGAADFDAMIDYPIELRPEEVKDVGSLEATAEEQQLTRLLEDEGFNGWMDEDWKTEVEEGLRAGVDVREGVDGSPQECHIASMRKFAKELYDGGFLETDSLRRTRSGSVFA